MNERTDWVDPAKLTELNAAVYSHGRVDREDILTFLKLIDTTDGITIAKELEIWLTGLHNDPKYDKIVFPQGDIDNIVSDLDSYGVVQATTLLKMKEDSPRNL